MPSLLEPRHRRALASLEGGDPVALAEGEGELVDALDEAILPERIDLEAIDCAIRRGNLLRREIDNHLRARRRCEPRTEPCALFLAQHNRQHAILEAIVEEDVAEARRDKSADTVIMQRDNCI